MGNATSIFNVMRNIGGSIGISMVATIYARTTQKNTNILGAHVTQYNETARTMLRGMASAMPAGGGDPPTAMKQALAAVFGMVQQQAAMLAFIHCFRFLSIMFVCCVPLIYIMRKPKHHGGPGTMAH